MFIFIMAREEKRIEGELVDVSPRGDCLFLSVVKAEGDDPVILYGQIEEDRFIERIMDPLEVGGRFVIDYYLHKRTLTGHNVDLEEYRFTEVRRV